MKVSFVSHDTDVTVVKLLKIFWCNQARTRHCENGVHFQSFLNMTEADKTFKFPTEFHVDFVFVATDNNAMELVTCRTKISGYNYYTTLK